MNFDSKGVLSALIHQINHIADWLWSMQATISHKVWTVTVGGGAIYTTGSAFAHSDGASILDRILNMFTGMTPLEFLSMIATLLLIIERGFICWAWYKRRQRGDYEEGKPQDDDSLTPKN